VHTQQPHGSAHQLPADVVLDTAGDEHQRLVAHLTGRVAAGNHTVAAAQQCHHGRRA
jgi:hypothetical protein